MRKRFESPDTALFNSDSCFFTVLWFLVTMVLIDSWHVLNLYDDYFLADESDYSELLSPVQSNNICAQNIQRYRTIKQKIETYNDMDELFHLRRRKEQCQTKYNL